MEHSGSTKTRKEWAQKALGCALINPVAKIAPAKRSKGP